MIHFHTVLVIQIVIQLQMKELKIFLATRIP